jgi:hypothetical protein
MAIISWLWLKRTPGDSRGLFIGGSMKTPGRTGAIPEREALRYSLASALALPGTLLDIGCSCGYGSRLMRPDIKYIGADNGQDKDLSTDIISYAKLQFPEHTFLSMDAHDVKEFYDNIVCFEILEHIQDGREMAQELKKHCNQLMITVPYDEVPGFWGPSHVIHRLTPADFPGFRFLYLYHDISPTHLLDKKYLMFCIWNKL